MKKLFFQKFKMKDLRKLEFFLGNQIVRDRKNRTIKLGETQYVK